MSPEVAERLGRGWRRRGLTAAAGYVIGTKSCLREGAGMGHLLHFVPVWRGLRSVALPRRRAAL